MESICFAHLPSQTAYSYFLQHYFHLKLEYLLLIVVFAFFLQTYNLSFETDNLSYETSFHGFSGDPRLSEKLVIT